MDIQIFVLSLYLDFIKLVNSKDQANVQEKPLVSSLLASGIGKKTSCNLKISAINW